MLERRCGALVSLACALVAQIALAEEPAKPGETAPANATCQVGVARVAKWTGLLDEAALTERLAESLKGRGITVAVLTHGSLVSRRLGLSAETQEETRHKGCRYLLITSVSLDVVPPWGRPYPPGRGGDLSWWYVRLKLLCIACEEKAYSLSFYVDEGTKPADGALSGMSEAADMVSGEVNRRAKARKKRASGPS